MDAVVALVAAGISFLAAVVAVVVGQLLGQQFQRQADDLRWKREDANRRRQTGENVARLVREEFLAAVNELSLEAGVARARKWATTNPQGARRRRWLPPFDKAVERGTAAARRLVIELPDAQVRRFVDRASTALERYEGGPGPEEGRLIAKEVDDVLGAYLRGEGLPATPEVDRMNESIDELYAIREAAYREEQKLDQAAPATTIEPDL